jgi:hypothetical protein
MALRTDYRNPLCLTSRQGRPTVRRAPTRQRCRPPSTHPCLSRLRKMGRIDQSWDSKSTTAAAPRPTLWAMKKILRERSRIRMAIRDASRARRMAMLGADPHDALQRSIEFSFCSLLFWPAWRRRTHAAVPKHGRLSVFDDQSDATATGRGAGLADAPSAGVVIVTSTALSLSPSPLLSPQGQAS